MKTQNLKIAIFPIGSSLKFSKSKLKRSDGTSEYFKLFYGLARNASVSEVWILQRSDWKKLSYEEKCEIDPRGVIRDIYTEFEVKLPPGRRHDENGILSKPTEEEERSYEDLWNKVKDIQQPDFGLGFATQGLTMVNIPGIIPSIKDPSRMTGALDMTRIYSSPVVHYLNMSKIPWYMIMTDPRYVKKKQKWRDLVNGPREGIAQYNDTIEFVHYDTYPNPSLGKEISDTLTLHYSGIEKLNLIGEPVIKSDEEKEIKFSIVAMQSSYGNEEKDYRLEELKKWVLNHPDSKDWKIYGKWAERFTQGYPQFQGYMEPEQIDKIFKQTRYTLVIPIRPHWVTSKYAEMLRLGVIPFLHPEYDTQYSLVPKDHYIRVSTPNELYSKIEELETNPEKRHQLIKELQIKFLAGVRKGTFLANIINPFLERSGVSVRMTEEFTDELLRKPNGEKIELKATKESFTTTSLF